MITAILISTLVGAYYFILGHCILPTWYFPKTSPTHRVIIGSGIIFSLQAFSALMCSTLEIPMEYALFVPPFITALFYISDPFPSIRQSFEKFPIKFFLFYLLCAWVMLFNLAGYPYIDNVMRIADWTFYFIESQVFLGGAPELAQYNLDKIPFRRPPFYPLTLASWFTGIGSHIWAFQGISIFLNSLFYLAMAQIICDYFPKKLRAVLFCLFFLSATHFYFLTFLWPKHLAAFLVLAAFFALQHARQTKWFLVLSALLWVSGYCVHQSALFYIPLLAIPMFKMTKPWGVIRSWCIWAGVFLVPPMAFQISRFGWFYGLFGSPTTTQNYTHTVSGFFTKWAFAFGSNFFPAYPLYGAVFDDAVPPGFWAKAIHLFIMMPAHICDVWYLAGDFLGVVLLMLMLIPLLRKPALLMKTSARHLAAKPFSQLTLVCFFSVSIGIIASPYWQYGSIHTIGLIALNFLGLVIFSTYLERKKPLFSGKVLAMAALTMNILIVWGILIAMSIGFHDETSIFHRVFFWDNGSEKEIKLSHTYLFDLVGQSVILPLVFGIGAQCLLIYGVLSTSFFDFFSSAKQIFEEKEDVVPESKFKLTPKIWLAWALFSFLTFAMAQRVFDVYPGANRLIILFPLVGYQMAFWIWVLLYGVSRTLGGKPWRYL